MKVRHKWFDRTGVAIAQDGDRIRVQWNEKPAPQSIAYIDDLVFIVPAGRQFITPLDAWRYFGLPHPADTIAHRFVADPYRPARCLNCGSRYESHAARSRP
ncbi:hypothetical protein EOA32_00765 [Mesorhizobium sp. M1A.F.Ca.ET.072.01.1.1]|uniref:hypothetical protein n=1 Tax=Mesorhizobium sp. M1A.F.Ca.ET.072.01.1.1 TaxID=2496753 RepID=UPI000FD40693|nr:hypothetical protein [Mesorhizobium sp. M1A.F.Ca.ET.072.01.1.1]RUW55583.1 hypothetical protein EOA32_00765 [Mesorhizobium sp. M1A.F.Ca.ET.072.01.1.1]